MKQDYFCQVTARPGGPCPRVTARRSDGDKHEATLMFVVLLWWVYSQMHVCLLLLLRGQRSPFPPLDPLDPEQWQSSDLELRRSPSPCSFSELRVAGFTGKDAPVVGSVQRRGNAVCRNQSWNRGRRMLIAQRAQSQTEFKKEGKGELHNKTHQNNLETTLPAERGAAPVAVETPAIAASCTRVLARIPRRTCLPSVAPLLLQQRSSLSFLVKRMNL